LRIRYYNFYLKHHLYLNSGSKIETRRGLTLKNYRRYKKYYRHASARFLIGLKEFRYQVYFMVGANPSFLYLNAPSLPKLNFSVKHVENFIPFFLFIKKLVNQPIFSFLKKKLFKI